MNFTKVLVTFWGMYAAKNDNIQKISMAHVFRYIRFLLEPF